MAHGKCVNIHGSLQCRHSWLNDWLPFCPLRLSAAVTRSPPAKRACMCAFAKHQFVSVKPCLCIQWPYFQIFIPWKPTVTSGEHILSGSWPFRPAEMNPAVYSCPPFIFYCMRYIVSLFLLLPDIWLLGGQVKMFTGNIWATQKTPVVLFHYIVFFLLFLFTITGEKAITHYFWSYGSDFCFSSSCRLF